MLHKAASAQTERRPSRAMPRIADGAALGLGIDESLQRGEEAIAGVDEVNVGAEAETAEERQHVDVVGESCEQ